jgi:plasmid stabilization system protein ParE
MNRLRVGPTLAPLVVVVACAGAGMPLRNAADNRQPATTQEALGDSAGLDCAAVRPEEGLDLMAWDPGSRTNLNRLRKRSVVAVHYSADGCHVELELLPDCISKEAYRFEPYASNGSKMVTDEQELFSELPLGAGRLAPKLECYRALRTDYRLAGMLALPPNPAVEAGDFQGPGCARATHFIDRIYLGGFGMVSGDERVLSAEVTVFGAGASASRQGGATRLADEGNPEQCQEGQETGEERPLCSVPLRIELTRINGAGQTACAQGATWSGTQCVGTVSANCPSGTRFVSGQGCVASAVKVPSYSPSIPGPCEVFAEKSIEDAIEYYLAKDPDKAESVLRGIGQRCERRNSRELLARVWMYIGIVRGSRDDGSTTPAGSAVDAFRTATSLDPDIALDEALSTQAATEAFLAVRGRGVGSAPLFVPDGSGTGTLTLDSVPVSYAVVDGRPAGITPTRVSVATGRHTVLFYRREDGRRTVSVDVRAGQVAAAVVRF